MYNTTTGTATYTVIDIRKTFEGCEADIRMIARRTGKWTIEYTDKIFHDIICLAENKYLKSVSIILQDSTEKVLRATKFTVSEDGKSISSDRAGNNDWESIPETKLNVLLSYTSKWGALSTEQQSKFESENLKFPWTPTTIDSSFSHLTKSRSQLYASNGYELQKDTYK